MHTQAPPDFDFLQGRWQVRHRRLVKRLAGCTDWELFDGRSELWLVMGGAGTVDDNVIDLPSGSYRAATLRSWNPAAQTWQIWWLDARNPTEIVVAHEERSAGESKYSLYSLIRLNFDLVTGFSLVPLQFFSILGIALSLLSDRATAVAGAVAGCAAVAAYALPYKLNIVVAIAGAVAMGLLMDRTVPRAAAPVDDGT